MNTYNVTLRYEDRKAGSEGRTIKIDASSIAGAIGKATREFVKSLDRKQRFDMNKGLKIEAFALAPTKRANPKARPKRTNKPKKAHPHPPQAPNPPRHPLPWRDGASREIFPLP